MQNGSCHTKETHFLHSRHTSVLRVISGLYPDRHACDRISSTNSLVLIPKTSFFGLFVNDTAFYQAELHAAQDHGPPTTSAANSGEVGG
jgi:hypothetical protein